MIPKPAVDLILEFEGIDQPGKWPGASSGITLGRGYDLAHETRDELRRDWAVWLGIEAVERLATAVGKSGTAAAAIAPRFRDIKIAREAADTVFLQATLPKYEQQTRRTFPGSDLLPDLIRGALVSLVFNRGTSLTGDRRREMRSIHELLADWSERDAADRTAKLPALAAAIAAQFRHMKRIWIGTDIERGMTRRREAEARLVESSVA